MALGTPVVSTTIGAQGLDLRHDADILLADTPVEFAEQTARALRDAELRTRLASAGRATVTARLAWPMLGQQLSEFYAKRFGR